MHRLRFLEHRSTRLPATSSRTSWIACFDLAAPTFRHEQYTEYKATRRKMPDDLRDQFPIVREIIGAVRIPIYQLEGFEADDVIATLVRQAETARSRRRSCRATFDLLQIVSDQTRLVDDARWRAEDDVLRPGQGHGALRAATGADGRLQGVKGDTTEHLPGTRRRRWRRPQPSSSRTGAPSTASSSTSTKLRSRRSFGQASRTTGTRCSFPRDLVTVRADVPVELDLEPARLGNYDRAEVLRLFRDYELRSLVERLPGMAGEEARAPGDLLREADRSAPIPAAQVAGRPLSRAACRGRRRRRRRHAAEPRAGRAGYRRRGSGGDAGRGERPQSRRRAGRRRRNR